MFHIRASTMLKPESWVGGRYPYINPHTAAQCAGASIRQGVVSAQGLPEVVVVPLEGGRNPPPVHQRANVKTGHDESDRNEADGDREGERARRSKNARSGVNVN